MLVALTSGKAGRIKQDIAAGAGWRDLFHSSEDLLTASVFNRLCYLEGPVLWRVLRLALGAELPEFKVVELYNVEFWPTWQDSEGLGTTVEPDVFLQFKAGDPVQYFDLIIEAKLGTNFTQYGDQWRREWTAYNARPAKADTNARAFLVAIGGLGLHERSAKSRIVQELQQVGLEVTALAANWPRILEAVNLILREVMNNHEQRILKDIVNAFALSGYRSIEPLSGLKSHRQIHQSSKEAFCRL